MSVQSPAAVVMIRPARFTPNPETAADNAFQSLPNLAADEVAARAQAEFDGAVAGLEAVGVRVHVFQDEADNTPDSVFPNNWFSTHHGEHLAIYPMYAESRRRERRADVIEMLKRDYRVAEVTDYSGLEADGLLLALSERAAAALSDEQRARLEATLQLVPLPLPTIESVGGSARCMIAGVHLAPRTPLSTEA